MKLSQRIFQNTFALVFGQSLGVLLSFLTSIFIVRGLGTVGYGQYSLVYAILSLFAWLVTFGMDNILVRESARDRKDAGKIWANAMLLQFVFAGIATILMLIVSIQLGYPTLTIAIFLIGSLEILWIMPLMLVSRILQVDLQQWRAVVASLFRQLVWLGVAICLFQTSMSVLNLVLTRTVVAFLEIILLWWLAKPYIHLIFDIDLSLILRILRNSWPLAATALFIAMYHRIDRVIIERYLNAEQLGYYATADNIAGLLSIVPVAFMTSIYPTLSVHADQGRVFSYISDLSTRWVTIFCVGLAGVISISSQLLINSIYGIEFLPSGSVLGILVWAQIAVSLGVVLAQIFISKNLQTYLLISTLLGSVINIIGNLVLIPIYGISGSAWATVISYSVAGIFGFLIYLPTRKVSTNAIRILFRVLLVCGIGIGISYAFRGHLIISIVAYSVVFCIGLLVSGLVTKMDISLVKGMLPIKIVVADQDSR